MQMLELRPAWDAFSRVWVTFDKSDARSLLRDERVVYAHGPTNRHLGNMLRNLALARRVLKLTRPSALVTTGAGVAVPFAWLARMRRIPVVYIESFTRIDELSLSGRMIRPIAERLYVQWPEAPAKTGGQYAGTVFAER
jgi:beta-1,4-N-acetylglucosaminyltransferase